MNLLEKSCENAKWINMTQDRDRRCAVLDKVTTLLVPQKAENVNAI